MKLLGERNFSWRDRKREVMVFIAKGQEFDADEGDEETAKEIYNIIQSGKATVIDEKFVRAEGDYVGLHNFEEQRGDSSWLRVRPGHSIKLRQAEASRLMARGFVRPERDSTWAPQKLLAGGMISMKEPRKMFDDLLPPGENWIRKAMR